jgi:hypothetical protein
MYRIKNLYLGDLEMLDNRHVILDYCKDDGSPAIAVGSKEAMEKRLEELKRALNSQENSERYDIMPVRCYKIAFGIDV